MRKIGGRVSRRAEATAKSRTKEWKLVNLTLGPSETRDSNLKHPSLPPSILSHSEEKRPLSHEMRKDLCLNKSF